MDPSTSPKFPPGPSEAGGPPRCDFCTVRPLHQLAGAMDFALTRPLEVVEVDVVLPVAGMLGLALARRTIPRGTWGACAVCAPVVARRDPDHLAHHVLAQWVASGRLATPADLTSLSSLYRLLLPALGPPTPSPPTEVW